MWPSGVWYAPRGDIYSRMRKWQSLAGIVIICSSVRGPFDVVGNWTNKKRYEMTKGKSKIKSWTHNWSLKYLPQHHVQGFAFCISHRYCIACTSNNNSHSEWYLVPTFFTLIENNYFSIYDNTYLWLNILLGYYQKSVVKLHCIFISWIVGPTPGHIKSVPTVRKRIISSMLT
jgi:hypothetical protein